jgi:hypothetical protein
VKKIDVPFARRLSVSADGTKLAALYSEPDQEHPERIARARSSDHLRIIDLKGETEPQEYKGRGLDRAEVLAFSPDGKRIATGHEKGEAWVWTANWAPNEPRALKIDTPLDVFPLWLDDDMLALFAAPRTAKPLRPGEIAKEDWVDMHWHDLSVNPPKVTRWRLENAMPQHYGGHYITGRYAITTDGRRLVAACNGFSTINLITRKVERAFPGGGPLAPGTKW